MVFLFKLSIMPELESGAQLHSADTTGLKPLRGTILLETQRKPWITIEMCAGEGNKRVTGPRSDDRYSLRAYAANLPTRGSTSAQRSMAMAQ